MGLDVLTELEPVVAANIDRHLSVARDWLPHEYVPWQLGRDFVAEPWQPSDSGLSRAAQAALEVNLLTEDNLPSYHREIAERFGRDGAWGTWVGRWTAEEGRHGSCIRDYLLVTRAVDPARLEADRMAVMQAGYDSGGKGPLDVMAYVSFQELATRIAHRNTGRYIGEPVGEKMLARVATDENLHMIFYRSLTDAALELAPSAMVRAITSEVIGFAMPGTVIPDFARKSLLIAAAGIYNLRIHHDEVITPLLRHWKFFELTGLDPEAEAARERLAVFLENLSAAASAAEERFAARAQPALV